MKSDFVEHKVIEYVYFDWVDDRSKYNNDNTDDIELEYVSSNRNEPDPVCSDLPYVQIIGDSDLVDHILNDLFPRKS